MDFPYLPASPGLCLLPTCRAPGLLPPPNGAQRSQDPAAAGEHLKGEQPPYSHGQAFQAMGQTKGPVYRLGRGGLGLWFQGNRSSIFPLLTRTEGVAGTVLACPEIHGPCPAKGSASIPGPRPTGAFSADPGV